MTIRSDWMRTVTHQPGYSPCFEIAKKNSRGFMYLVGGSVFRFAAWSLYDGESEYANDLVQADFDFLVEELVDAEPPQWWSKDTRSSSTEQCPRFEPCKPGTLYCADGHTVQFSPDHLVLVELGIATDVLPIRHLYGLQGRSSVTVDDYFKFVPLTIQALAVRLNRRTGAAREVCGDRGLAALESRTIAINNEDSALFSARRRDMTVQEYARQKAASIGFEFVE